MASLLADNKLKLKDGTHIILSMIKSSEILTVPINTTWTLSPFGNPTIELTLITFFVYKLGVQIMWSDTPVSIIQKMIFNHYDSIVYILESKYILEK